jgi:hypothetical protein
MTRPEGFRILISVGYVGSVVEPRYNITKKSSVHFLPVDNQGAPIGSSGGSKVGSFPMRIVIS